MIEYIREQLRKLPKQPAYFLVNFVGQLLAWSITYVASLDANPILVTAVGTALAQAAFYWTPVTEEFGTA